MLSWYQPAEVRPAKNVREMLKDMTAAEKPT
jgi:hypothetical protein